MSKYDGRHIRVSCAIIECDGLVLAAQRRETMAMPLKWEFPGGKLKRGEEPEACLKRELMEEMGVSVLVKRSLPPATHHYPDFTITLYPFVCVIEAGEIILNDHRAIALLTPAALASLDWAAADFPVIEAYQHSLNLDIP